MFAMCIEPTKLCRGCGLSKALTEFQRNRASRDGRQSLCKPCNTDRLRAYRREKPEVANRAAKRWADRNPQKRRAHRAVLRALQSGKLVKPSSCERCMATGELDAHHVDYAKPLAVEWLCRTCHKAEHPVADPTSA